MVKNSEKFTVTAKNLRTQNVLPFIGWPLLFLVIFYLVYTRVVALYIENIKYKGSNTAYELAETFHEYMGKLESTLDASANAIDYMMSNDATDEEIHEYLVYETEKLNMEIDGAGRSLFGVFRGVFMDGAAREMEESYDAFQRPWYREAVKKGGEVAFCGPVMDGRTHAEFMTASRLLGDNVSVISYAIDIEALKKMTVDKAQSDESRIVFIINTDGTIVAHTHSEEIGQNYATTDNTFKKALYKSLEEHPDSSTYRLNSTGEYEGNYVVSLKRVIGELYVVTITNADSELIELYRAAIISMFIFAVGMLLILGLNLITLSKDMKAKVQLDNLKSIANIYVVMARINIPEDSLLRVTCNDYRITQLAEQGGEKASEILAHIAGQVVDERSKGEMLSFVDLTNLNDRMRSNDTITIEYLSDEHIWHRARFAVVDRDEAGNLQNVIIATEIIDEEKRVRDRFQYLAETDQLTGIYNRGSGESKIRDLLLKNVGGMFILFDVDKFKYVNDTFGHAVGDEVLIAIAEKMRHTFRGRDIVMRLGGDEFAAYIPAVYKKDEGKQILDRFINAVHNMNITKLGDHKIDISIGAAFFYPTDTFSFEELYKRADSGTYESKKVQGSYATFYRRMDSDLVEGGEIDFHLSLSEDLEHTTEQS